jgi:hypothetical protein
MDVISPIGTRYLNSLVFIDNINQMGYRLAIVISVFFEVFPCLCGAGEYLVPDSSSAITNNTANSILTNQLLSENFHVRMKAIRQAVDLDVTDKKKLIPELIRVLENSNNQARINALFALEALGPASVEAVPVLRQATKDPTVSSHAIRVLGKIGQDAVGAVPDLVVALKSSELGIVQVAAYALAGIGPSGSAAIAPLTDLLNHESENIRWAAAYALGSMGSLAKSASPQLIRLLSDPSETVRDNTKFALSRIESFQNKAAFGVVVDSPSLTVQFPMYNDAAIGSKFWIHAGLGVIAGATLVSKHKNGHPCSTPEHGEYTYGLLKISSKDSYIFKTGDKRVFLVSDSESMPSPIARYLKIDHDPKIPGTVMREMDRLIEEHNMIHIRDYSSPTSDGNPYTAADARILREGTNILDKKKALVRYELGKNLALLRVNSSWAYEGKLVALASFDFIMVGSDTLKLWRMASDDTESMRRWPTETTHASIGDLNFYKNIFDFESDGLAEVVEDVSGYESCGTLLYKVLDPSGILLDLPALEFSGGL